MGAKTMLSRIAGEQRPNSILDYAMFHSLLPTPTTQEPSSPCTLTHNGRRQSKDGKNSYSLNLGRIAAMNLLPTPTARDWKGLQGNEYKQLRGEPVKINYASLPGMVHQLATKPTPPTGDIPTPTQSKTTGSAPIGKLNPRFVAEMMGFPPMWTELPFLASETSQSKATEMR
jgi:hypothetical protein